MSLSSGIDQYNPDVNLRARFYPDLIPWEADPRGDMTLGAVLQNGNSAFIPNTTTKQDATDFDTLGCVKIETGTVGQGNNVALVVGEVGDNLQIKGGTALGSLLVGNGLNTEELVCPTTTTTATTGTIYNWLSLANGQSRDFFVSDGTLYQLGYSITIVYSGTDSITGTITAIAGNLITITIASFTSQAYASTTLITTTPPDPATATSGGGDPVFIFNPAVCTPATIPNNSFLLTGLCYLYGAPPVVGSSNISLTAQASPPAINGTTNIFAIPQYELPPVSTTAFNWGTAGCFIPDGTSVSLASNTGGNQIAFAFPLGGSFINQNFTGSVSGYTLAYTPNGAITINSKLVLTADNTKPLGVFWGVDAQGVGAVVSVSAGTNISVSGSLSAPVVNLLQPLTSTLGMGTVALTDKNNASGTAGQFLSAGTGGETEWATPPDTIVSVQAGTNISITGTGTAPIVNFATPTTSTITLGAGMDIASQQVVGLVGAESIDLTAGHLNFLNSTTGDNSSYVPTQIGFSDALANVFSSLTNIGLNFTDNGNGAVATLGADSGLVIKPTPLSASGTELTYTKLEIIKEDPIALTIETTTANKDGFTTITEQTPAGSGNKGASTITSDTTQGEVSVLYQNQAIGSVYQGTGSIICNPGTSTMTLTSADITAGTSHLLRMECPQVGDALIEHQVVGVGVRNLDITTPGQFSVVAGSAGGFSIATPAGTFQTAIAGNASGSLIASGVNHIFRTTSNTSTATNASYLFQSEGASTASYPAIKMDRPVPASGTGETIGTIGMWADDASSVSREYIRLQAKTENVSPGNVDGTLSVLAIINSSASPTEIFNFNGGQNEINTFRPFDLNGNALRTSQGDMSISTSASAGNGVLTLATKDGTGGLSITGDKTISATAGGSSGQHLVLTIQGVVYKIALLNP